jgi:hypothetical protein
VLTADRTYTRCRPNRAAGGPCSEGLSITLTKPANVTTVRFSIPDTADGAGQTAQAPAAASAPAGALSITSYGAIARNTLMRAGSFEPTWNSPIGALRIHADSADISAPIAVTDMAITGSSYQSVLLNDGGYTLNRGSGNSGF